MTGEGLLIDDCRLMVGDCKMAPWAVVSLEWSWVYGSTWVLFCQMRCGVDSRLRGNDVGGIDDWGLLIAD